MSNKEILRLQAWRLGIIRHVEEVTGNIAKTCRYYGISRTAYYRWLKRYEKYGVESSISIEKELSDIHPGVP
jgi:transposase-like protein